VPSACGGGSECDGPGGLCLTPPGAKGGTKGDAGPGADSGDREGGMSNTGGSASAGKGGASGQGGLPQGGSPASSGQGGLPQGGSSAGSGQGGSSTKGGAGGLATGGALGGCMPLSAFAPSCEPSGEAGHGGEGGAGSNTPGWCEVDSGQGGQGGEPTLPAFGMGGTTANPQGGSGGFGGNLTLIPIDDFEDGDDLSLPVLGGKGAWSIVNDGTGIQSPAPCATPSPKGRAGSTHAFRTFGRDFFLDFGGFARLTLNLRSGPPECNAPIDASEADGVHFWVMSNVPIRFSVATIEVTPVDQDGTCGDPRRASTRTATRFRQPPSGGSTTFHSWPCNRRIGACRLASIPRRSWPLSGTLEIRQAPTDPLRASTFGSTTWLFTRSSACAGACDARIRIV